MDFMAVTVIGGSSPTTVHAYHRCVAMESPWMVKQKIDYIHKNPINERLTENVADYPWSSWEAIYERSGEPIPVDPLPVSLHH